MKGNYLFYVRANPHCGDSSGASLGVPSEALLHVKTLSQPCLNPVCLDSIPNL